MLHPGKNGFNHVHQTKGGKVLAVYPDMKSYNWTTGYNIAKGEWENMLWPQPGEKTLVCPAIDGGHSWEAGTYSPRTKLFYRVAQEWCMYLTVQPKSGGTTISAGAESAGSAAVRPGVHERRVDRHAPAGRQEPRPAHGTRSGHRQARLGEAL